MLSYSDGNVAADQKEGGKKKAYDFLLLVSTAYGVVSSKVASITPPTSSSFSSDSYEYSEPELYSMKPVSFKVNLTDIKLPKDHVHTFESP